ncbi:hypothetical protein IEO21_03493 [Rhodonia placenta]|uniref:Uncharacterized protein n=1 Tax=Rhodonia placenta TaxID=104341 RepID=A0A8H7P5V6_9APHY|nr:hypothetical protein IEO21_03493 [Postia placenta]
MHPLINASTAITGLDLGAQPRSIQLRQLHSGKRASNQQSAEPRPSAVFRFVSVVAALVDVDRLAVGLPVIAIFEQPVPLSGALGHRPAGRENTRSCADASKRTSRHDRHRWTNGATPSFGTKRCNSSWTSVNVPAQNSGLLVDIELPINIFSWGDIVYGLAIRTNRLGTTITRELRGCPLKPLAHAGLGSATSRWCGTVIAKRLQKSIQSAPSLISIGTVRVILPLPYAAEAVLQTTTYRINSLDMVPADYNSRAASQPIIWDIGTALELPLVRYKNTEADRARAK